MAQSSEEEVLFYFSKSADKAPGKGANEKVKDENAYKDLAGFKHWRRILSNFHEGEFEYEGYRYRTVEHCFHAQKIALVDPAKAIEFSLGSGSKLSKGDGNLARKHRKMVILDNKALSRWNEIKFNVLEKMQFCKLTLVEEAKKVLLATGNAQLWHGSREIPKAR